MSACKCGARSYDDHLERTEDGYAAHTYRGPTGALVIKED